MAKFNLAEAVDQLEYDFRTPANPDGEYGIIPEPTSDQIAAFRTVLAATFPTTIGPTGEAVVDIKALAAKVQTADEGSALEDLLYQAVTDLCSGHPSNEAIRGLPFRGQRAFVGWIVGTFLQDPQSAPATKS